MDGVKTESVWRRGRLWSAIRIGVPAGVAFGLLQFAQKGSAGAALFQGVFFAVLFGATMALVMWRSWRGASDLESADRVAVAGVVRRGESIEEARLAPAVLDYVRVVQRAEDRDRRYRWVIWVFAGLTLILAVATTVGGPVRAATVLWALTIFWAAFLLWVQPRQRARMAANASRAKDAATRLQHLPPS
jgi:hypothetical protein